MATQPQAGLFRDGRSCLPVLNDCGGDQSTRAEIFQGGNRQFIDHSEKMEEIEGLLAAELNKLSVQERSKALDDVHCMGEEVKETPEMIEQSLTEFDQVVQTTSDRIYATALNQNRSYVEDSSFRLKFLMKHMFDVKKSVNQMMNFLQQKALYFGEEKVAQDIVPEDMNTEEIALMRTGFFQILKDRDQSGKVILYSAPFGRKPADCKMETLIRVLYHIIFNIVIKIPGVQAKGIVIIYYDETKGARVTVSKKEHEFFVTLPLRVSSFHFCVYSSPGSLAIHNKLAQVALRTLSGRTLTRTRLHYGSDMEIKYELKTFGIPLDNFPVDKNGRVKSDVKMGWCEKYLENVTASTHINEQAGNGNGATQTAAGGISETDVLLGRGGILQYHAGNVRFRKFLEAHTEAYDSLPRYERKKACIRYTQELISSGTRFWKQTNDTQSWVECDFDKAVDKVSQFFRTCRHNKRQGKTGT